MAKFKTGEEKVKQIFAYAKEVDKENRRIRFVISDDKLDRHNEKVEVNAIKNAIPAFSKNPVALACHMHRLDSGNSPVIGSWDTQSYKAKKHTSEMDLVFAKTDLGEEYWQLYSEKHMRAVSIGFIVREYNTERSDKNGTVYIFTKIELLEISCVPVPANANALSKLKTILGNDLKEALNNDEPQGESNKELSEKIELILESIGEMKESIELINDQITDRKDYADLYVGEDQDDSSAEEKADNNGLEDIIEEYLDEDESNEKSLEDVIDEYL